MFIFTSPLMLYLRINYYQSCYCKCLNDKFIIAWWVHQKEVELKKQGIQTIISSSLIQYYVIFTTPTQKYDLSIKINVLLWVLHICKNHVFVIIIMAWAFFAKLKYQSCNAKNRRSGENSNCVFETYKNSAMSHGKHIFNTASDMSMTIMCSYPP